MHLLRPVVATLVVLAAAAADAQTLKVAAASDLQAALPALAARFEKESRCEVSLTFGSSGNFFAQIQNGAPFDVFRSADIDYPRQLEQAGQAEAGSLYRYATGRLVLWTRRDSGIDLRAGLSVLASPTVRRVAIANPDHAPYGRAAVAALRHEGLYDRVQAKLVRGENISQAAQFVQSGNAEGGVLALSLALAPTLARARASGRRRGPLRRAPRVVPPADRTGRDCRRRLAPESGCAAVHRVPQERRERRDAAVAGLRASPGSTLTTHGLDRHRPESAA